MIRKLITLVLPIALPIFICWLYLTWARYKARVLGQPEPNWNEGPWAYFVLAGVLLAGASLIFWRFYSGQELGSLLIPFSILPAIPLGP